MTMISGQRPFIYEDQPFPIRIPTGYSPGVMNESKYLGSIVFNVNQLGQAWFASLAELRSMPSGHPAANHYSSGVILGRSIIYMGPNGIDDPTTVIHYVSEPDPSGTAWTNPSGIPGYMQFDVFHHYIEDLRNLQGAVFSGIAQDYNGIGYETIRDRYLKAYFPNGSGYKYTQTALASGADAISMAEVQYNPYPRIAGQPSWSPSGEAAENINDGWHWRLLGISNHRDIIAGSYAEYKTTDHLNRNSASWPGFLPYPNETFAKYASLDCAGPIFPACQTTDGQLVPINKAITSGENEWWGDIAALGKAVGTYTLGNQAGVAHTSINDPYTNYVIDMDVSGLIGIMYYPQWAPYTQDWYCNWDTFPLYRNILEVESPLDIIWKQLEPLNIGYDPSDFLLGYMGYYKQEHENTVRVDGDAINNGVTKFNIVEPSDRTYGEWSTKNFIRYASSSIIKQSGSREIGDYESRNAHVGVNWQRYPAINHGFPSYSGEPVNQIAIATTPITISTSGLKTRRTWFQMPDTTTPGDGEQALTIQSPIFANRNNVKQVLVEDSDSIFNSDGILGSGIAAPSGELSIWPQDEDYNNGSGVGYHVMDNGIWMRRGPTNCGMTLISPYNGQRLLFKKAEDRSIVFGHTTDVWRTELRTSRSRDSSYGHDLSVWTNSDARLEDLTEERAYHVSWYAGKDEHAVHTDGKYLAYNISAQSPNVKIAQADYFDGDKWCGYPRGFNPGGVHTDDAGLANTTWFVRNEREDLIPPISFVDNYFKYSPLRSQATFIDTVTATKRTGTVLVDGEVDVYIANKPYCLWDIPGLEIQSTGVATVDMSTTLLDSLMSEGLAPAATVTTHSRWHKWSWQPPPNIVETTSYKGNDGWLVLRLQIFGLQESTKGGILEGWGRVFGTSAAGITSFNYNANGGAPGVNWEYAEHYIRFNGGWDSVPLYRTYNVSKNVAWASGPIGMYEGSRPFRVWIDIDDPTVVHCVDDVFDSGAYGIIHNSRIWRYHAADKDPDTARINIYSTQEKSVFIPGNLVDNSLRCIKSMTYIEDEVIAAVDVYQTTSYESLDDLSKYTFNRKLEIAPISYNPNTGQFDFDNYRAQISYRDPGRRFMRYLQSPTQGGGESRLEPFRFEHDGYAELDGPGWYYNELGAPILFRTNEVCDMWPKIVYAPIV